MYYVILEFFALVLFLFIFVTAISPRDLFYDRITENKFTTPQVVQHSSKKKCFLILFFCLTGVGIISFDS